MQIDGFKFSRFVQACAGLAALLAPVAAIPQNINGPDLADAEFRDGNTVPYSGPAWAPCNAGKAIAACFKTMNDAAAFMFTTRGRGQARLSSVVW